MTKKTPVQTPFCGKTLNKAEPYLLGNQFTPPHSLCKKGGQLSLLLASTPFPFPSSDTLQSNKASIRREYMLFDAEWYPARVQHDFQMRNPFEKIFGMEENRQLQNQLSDLTRSPGSDRKTAGAYVTLSSIGWNLENASHYGASGSLYHCKRFYQCHDLEARCPNVYPVS